MSIYDDIFISVVSIYSIDAQVLIYDNVSVSGVS